MECSSSTTSTRVACGSSVIERDLPFTVPIFGPAHEGRHARCEFLRRERGPHGRRSQPRGRAYLSCETANRAVAELLGDVLEQKSRISHVVLRPREPRDQDHGARGRQSRAIKPTIKTASRHPRHARELIDIHELLRCFEPARDGTDEQNRCILYVRQYVIQYGVAEPSCRKLVEHLTEAAGLVVEAA